jgi:glycosyltransferase involved in cell wall biosynthesis
MNKVLPKISIVTPSYNQGEYIRSTVESVLNQNYSDFEHIIIDNCSDDNTLSIIKEYPHLTVISEKDKGAADAINKGMNIAKGEVCAWLNSDDYYEENTFADIGNAFIDKSIDLLYGNITFIYPEENNRIDKIMVKPYAAYELIHNTADSIRQAGIFFRKKLFEEVGGLDESLKLVFDYDLLIKMLQTGKQIYLNKNLAYQRMYKGTLSQKNIRKQAMEILRVSRRHGAKFNDKIILKSVIRKYLLPWMY